MRAERLSAQPKKVPLECRRACRLIVGANSIRDGFYEFSCHARGGSRHLPPGHARDVPVRYSAVPDSRLPRTQLPASSAERLMIDQYHSYSAPAEVSGDFFQDLRAVGNSRRVHRDVLNVSWKKFADTSLGHGAETHKAIADKSAPAGLLNRTGREIRRRWRVPAIP